MSIAHKDVPRLTKHFPPTYLPLLLMLISRLWLDLKANNEQFDHIFERNPARRKVEFWEILSSNVNVVVNMQVRHLDWCLITPLGMIMEAQDTLLVSIIDSINVTQRLNQWFAWRVLVNDIRMFDIEIQSLVGGSIEPHPFC